MATIPRGIPKTEGNLMSNRDRSVAKMLQDRYGEDLSAVGEDGSLRGRAVLAISQITTPLYQRMFSKRGEFVSDLEGSLKEANIKVPVQMYLSNSIAVGGVAGATVGVLLSLLIFLFFGDVFVSLSGVFGVTETTTIGSIIANALFLIKAIFLTVIFTTIWAVIGILSAVSVATTYPTLPASSRRREINMALPDVVGFMYSLSVGGMDTLDVFAAVAESEDTYGAAALEFREITNKMENFNMDYQTAVEDVADSTPSDALSKFLIDMLSVINSGGDIAEFFETQKERQMEQRKRNQKDMLDTLELFGEVYISLTILPLLLIVVLILMAMLGNAMISLLLLTVYVGIPVLNFLYFIAISSMTKDTVGNGILKSDYGDLSPTVSASSSYLSTPVLREFIRQSPSKVFQQIRLGEYRHNVSEAFESPGEYFINHPSHTVFFSVPVTLLTFVFVLVGGAPFPTPDSLQNSTIIQTFVWFGVPFFFISIPFTVAYEINQRQRRSITKTLTTDMRKLANANATGQPLSEAIRITGEGNDSKFGKELMKLYKQLKFGTPLGPGLVEVNNKYRIPRLARSLKLVQKAQETSDNITEVLVTAAELSEIEDELASEKKSRTQMQVAVIIVSFFVFIAVLGILELFFIQTITEILAENNFGDQASGTQFGSFGAVSPSFLSMTYVHAALLQGLCAGLISGYVLGEKIYDGLKVAIPLVLLTFLIWGGIAFV